jgi:uncharacterized MAPEG superfamily protein
MLMARLTSITNKNNVEFLLKMKYAYIYVYNITYLRSLMLFKTQAANFW